MSQSFAIFASGFIRKKGRGILSKQNVNDPQEILHGNEIIAQSELLIKEILESKIAKFPHLAAPYFWRGLGYLGRNKYSKALEYFERAMERTTPFDWQPLYQMKSIYENAHDIYQQESKKVVASLQGYFLEVNTTRGSAFISKNPGKKFTVHEF